VGAGRGQGDELRCRELADLPVGGRSFDLSPADCLERHFEAYWYSEEISERREEIIDLYVKPLLPIWCTPIASG